MPLANSYNALGFSNQQPEYQNLWHPFGINSASTSAITTPSAAGAGALVPGALMSFTTSYVGTNPGPGGDDDGSTNYTVAQVDLSPVSATVPRMAGILLGVGSLGGFIQPGTTLNTLGPSQTGPVLVAMVSTRGLCQVLCDNTTTAGHSLIASTTATHTGQCSDSGGTTYTYGTALGTIMQTVTVSAAPVLVWCKIDIPW